jgi:transglutaminase-like putative cysteine protease
MSIQAVTPQIPFYKTVIGFRIVWLAIAILAIQALLPLGTNSLVVIGFGAIGIIGASYLAHTRITNLGVTLGLLSAVIACSAATWLLQQVFGLFGITTFAIDRLSLHIGTCLMCMVAAGVATWIFWRVRAALVVEVLLVLFASITLFSGHRGFHLDRPKILNSIAWRLGVDHLSMLTIIGFALVTLALLYLFVASLAVRPRVDAGTVRLGPPRRRFIAGFVLVAAMCGMLYWIQQVIYSFYNDSMLARVANGVGMNANEGVSPLSFQSALGSTNQPAGLVRLEGDYSNNPFSPMMYLRESALSSFNGKEMVFAGRAYDEDLPVTNTRDSFSRKEDAELTERTPLIQSIYLLAEHDHAFAVDYPISIVQLKNPRPNRFKSTYRAYSVAPAYTLSALGSRQVGDPRWSTDVREHFLAQHPDTRYAELAKEITKEATSPIEKISAITNHLSRTAIYTLTPRHEVKPGEDPVAPFLFGDHRGYCVHFAHAIVYMARSLGIPARVGTGYLTDLSQAKDGHILLRMSDRHAWAEVFVTGIGWVPFDVQPDQVESHAETQVDAKLLEELMGVLEPGEEILPSDLTKNEAGVTEPDAIWVPTRQQVILFLASLLALLACGKMVILHAWRLAPTRTLAVRLAYIGVASRLYDLGLSRQFGETRGEFASRVPHGILTDLVPLVTQQAYSNNQHQSSPPVSQVMRASLERFEKLPRRSRLLAAVNPASLMKTAAGLLSGGGW